MSKSLKKKINRIMTYGERKKVRKIIANPPDMKKNSIVFTSTEDFSDNPRALYEYMIDNGYNDKYEITWLFEFDKNYREFNEHNVRSVRMFNSRHARTAEAQAAILSAEYVFFSHNVNWAKNFRPQQTYIDLWHGCGYKGRQPGEQRVIQFDYCVVTGDKYAKELTTHYLCTPDKLKALGYPRNDWFHTHKTRAAEYAAGLKEEHNADKMIIWMPTFRRSNVARITTETTVGEFGLPLIDDFGSLKALDDICKVNNVVLLIKTHVLQAEADADFRSLNNIVRADNAVLKAEDVNLYELLAQTDALITDYSSVAIDYILLDKAEGFILTDYEEYEKVRGWCYDNVKEYMPGHHIYTSDDLRTFIENVAQGRDDYSAIRRRVRREVQKESESYCKDILDYFGIKKG